MYNKLLISLLGAGVAAVALAGAAQANGFTRGSADTDILFEEGNFNMRAGATFVSPSRKYTKNGNPALVGTDYAASYVVPSFAGKLNVTDNVRCALTGVDNNGGDARYAAPTVSGKISEEFTTFEFGATCGVKFALGKGNLWFIGGGFQERFDYYRVNDYRSLGLGLATLDLEGTEMGYRAGIAYEIPEIALRAQLMYRSGTEYGAEGMLNAPAGVLAAALRARGVPDVANPYLRLSPAAQVPVAAVGEGNLPQTLELKVQSGIAPGWLAFGSVRWTDWSVQKSLDVNATSGLNISRDIYNWKDGWTVTGGVGHAFTDRVSGAVSLTYDQGVATGWDLSGDAWTLASGVSVKDTIGGELRAGVGLTYLASEEETKYAPAINAAADSGWAYAASISYKLKW